MLVIFNKCQINIIFISFILLFCMFNYYQELLIYVIYVLLQLVYIYFSQFSLILVSLIDYSIVPKSNAKICQVFLLYIWDGSHVGLLQSVKHFYLTDGYCPTCKNTQTPSYPQIDAIILYYYNVGVYLHFQKRQSLPQGGDVFNSHANFKIVPNFHTIHQIIPNSLRQSLR